MLRKTHETIFFITLTILYFFYEDASRIALKIEKCTFYKTTNLESENQGLYLDSIKNQWPNLDNSKSELDQADAGRDLIS